MPEDELDLGSRERIVILCIVDARDELGQPEITKRFLRRCTALSKPTLIMILRDFVDLGWITARESITDTGLQNPTIYSLTESAPTRRQLLGDGA